jgi:AcrR family transcriptional regulator
MPPPDTRERILDSAEQLFAERGIGETSLRALTQHAGVNLAAVHYHFGSKEGLLDAVVERLAAPINSARCEALDRLDESTRTDAATILRVFFQPVIERMEAVERQGRTTTLARLLARIESQPRDEVAQLFERHFGDASRRCVEALASALPELERAVVAERFHFANGVLMALFSDQPGFEDSCGGVAVPRRDLAARAHEAIAFATAGLCAGSVRSPLCTLAPVKRSPSVPPCGLNGRRIEVDSR